MNETCGNCCHLLYRHHHGEICSLNMADVDEKDGGCPEWKPMLKQERKKWWLISDEDMRKIRRGLEDAECACKVGGDDPAFWADLLHTLSSGLHETDAVPGDFREELLEPELPKETGDKP